MRGSESVSGVVEVGGAVSGALDVLVEGCPTVVDGLGMVVSGVVICGIVLVVVVASVVVVGGSVVVVLVVVLDVVAGGT